MSQEHDSPLQHLQGALNAIQGFARFNRSHHLMIGNMSGQLPNHVLVLFKC